LSDITFIRAESVTTEPRLARGLLIGGTMALIAVLLFAPLIGLA
jgi:hypothetical protein